MARAPTPDDDDRLFVDSVRKAFQVLEAFPPDTEDLSLSEICALTGMHKSAAQRFTHTLTRLGYLVKSETSRRYRLSSKVLASAHNFLAVNPLVNSATPHILELRRRVDMRVGMGCLLGEFCMYLVPLQSNIVAFRTANPGFQVPSYCTATGRVLLSHRDPEEARRILDASNIVKHTPYTKTDRSEIMEEIRKSSLQGYCITENELVVGEINIAVPIFDSKGAAVATVTASGLRNIWNQKMLEDDIAGLLLEASQSLTRR